MNDHGRRILAYLDEAVDWCLHNWRVLAVLVPAGTFVFFALFIFFGLTVAGAVSATRVLAVLEVILAGAIIGLHFGYRRQLNHWMDAADAIEALMSEEDIFSDWEEFIRSPSDDPEVERIRQRCLMLPDFFPPETPGVYCNAQGMQRLESYVTRLRGGLATRAFEVCTSWWTASRNVKKRSGAGTPEPQATSPSVEETTPATHVIAEPVAEPDEASEADDGSPAETPPGDAVPVEIRAPAKKATRNKKAGTSKKMAKKTATSRKSATAKKPTTAKKPANKKTTKRRWVA